MKIEWNRVTWYSKLAAVVVFLGTFLVAFNLGILWEQAHVETAITATPGASTGTPMSAPTGGKDGAHCGGFIRNALICATGYHCQLTVSRPDTGGTCVKD